MVGKDLIMATLFGSGGGSSGSGGGGAVAVSPKEVNFYDYDGTCVHAYTVAEAQALSELPAGPEHPGLVFQGWNWSLEGVKGLTRAMNIGAMYTTDDGTTRLYITLQEGRTSPMLGVGVNGTVTVDWGDGTEPDVLTGTSVSTPQWTPNHAYAAPGAYVIRLTVDGEMAFSYTTTTNARSWVLRHTADADGRNVCYQNSLTRVEVGNNASISAGAFSDCDNLSSIVVPNGVTSLGSRSFVFCDALRHITIPNSMTEIGYETMYFVYGMRVVSLPETLTKVGNYAFQGCEKLVSVFLPDSVTTINASAFSQCSSLVNIRIPNGVTSIKGNTFSSCTSLASVVVQGAVTNIESQAFNGNASASYYDFTACTAVPALAKTSAFSGIPADCEIRVPAALYDEWIAATNWATYADYIKAY